MKIGNVVALKSEYRETELVIKRSRFIARAARISNEDEYKAFIDRGRREHHASRHVCSAALYLDGDQVITRSSDDGEPSGTAGRPMLDVVQGSGLVDVGVIVIRYFGGILLGAGGLVHAYSEATSQVLDGIPTKERVRREIWRLNLNHADAGRVESELRAAGVHVADVSYANRVNLDLMVADADETRRLIADITRGACTPEVMGERTLEI
ncbi:IMPACT family protein [Dermabacteraceae bacterium P13115]